MKKALAVLMLGAGLTVWAQDVFVLGGPGSTPVPPIVYQPPVWNGTHTATYQPVLAAVPVAPICTAAAYTAPGYYNGYNNRNVIYVGGPGSCGPNYYDYPPCSTRNVIYFGRTQSYREGYHFRHCR